jgi:CheY-like chemotaxis protein
MGMAANPTLLCIHRDPAQLRVLQENGYDLLTAANGNDGLRLFRSRPVDAIVLEYNLGLLDGSVIATEIKQVRPTIPIVMVAEHSDLPDGALQSVDVLVSTSDPPHFLWAAVHFLLTVKPTQHGPGNFGEQLPALLYRSGRLRRSERSSEPGNRGPGSLSNLPTERVSSERLRTEERDTPFSPKVWKSIRNGTIQF